MPARRSTRASSPSSNGQASGKNSSAHPARSRGDKIRYAVVGLGHIAQVAVLPAFAHARNSTLAAFVSSDATKLKTLSRKYGVSALYDYDQYDQCLRSGDIDAVYIALPNNMHREYTVRAAQAGIHVLCEKPLAVTQRECAEMIRACASNNVRLMTAYRLHFDPANLEAVKLASSGKLGDLRLFSSVFTMNVKDKDNIRVQADKGGGPLYDIGIYCINAVRMLFRDEPEEVFASAATPDGDPRFTEVDATVSAVMRYPGDRLATFTCSFAAADNAHYQLMGSRGQVCLDPAYEYAESLAMEVTIDEKTREQEFPRTDQFAAELVYFSDCILNRRNPEPSGFEGLLDIRIIEALNRSLRIRRPVRLAPLPPDIHPTPRQRITLPPVRRKPKAVKAKSPH